MMGASDADMFPRNSSRKGEHDNNDDDDDDDVIYAGSSSSSSSSSSPPQLDPRRGLHQYFDTVESPKSINSLSASNSTSRGDNDIFNQCSSHRPMNTSNHQGVKSLVRRYLAVKRDRTTQDVSSSSSLPSTKRKHTSIEGGDATADEEGSKKYLWKQESHQPVAPPVGGRELRDDVEEVFMVRRGNEEVAVNPTHNEINHSTKSGKSVEDAICLLDDSDDDDECSVSEAGDRTNHKFDNDHDATDHRNKPTIEHPAQDKTPNYFDPHSFNESKENNEISRRDDDRTNGVEELRTNSCMAYRPTVETTMNACHPLLINTDHEKSRNEGYCTTVVEDPCASTAANAFSSSLVEVSGISPVEFVPPSKIRYPVGCPVWYNIRYSIPCSKYVLAEKGVVRSVFFHEDTKTMRYTLEKQQSPETRIGQSVVNNLESVKEEDIAFAIRCPVQLAVNDGSNTKVDGEIINVRPAITNCHGARKILYTVLLHESGDNGGGVRIEDNVQADRVCYRLSLHAIQSRLRHVVGMTSSHHQPHRNVALGIRSDEYGQPLRNNSPPQLRMFSPPPTTTKVVTKLRSLVMKRCRSSRTTPSTTSTVCADLDDNDEVDDGIDIDGSSDEGDSSWEFGDDDESSKSIDCVK